MEVVITALGPDNVGLADPIIHYVTGAGAKLMFAKMSGSIINISGLGGGILGLGRGGSIYGITKGLPLRREILLSEVKAQTPYNTYAIAGLPPTPIANPGRESLEAVLNPPQTTELFFVADGTGGHVFAETFEEHQRNVAKWRQIKAQQMAAGVR